jgi:hypothetical protein
MLSFICKTLSQQKHFVLQSTAPLQLKRFTVGSKIAIAASAPVLPNRIKQCCKIARFTDTPCTNISIFYKYLMINLLLRRSNIRQIALKWGSRQRQLNILFIFSSAMAQQPLVGQGLLIIDASRSYSGTTHSVGLLWTSIKHFIRKLNLCFDLIKINSL